MREKIGFFAFVALVIGLAIIAQRWGSNHPKSTNENSSITAKQSKRLVGGKNVDAARVDEQLKNRIEGLEKEARLRGWNITRDFSISKEDYARFFERLLVDGRVVETGAVGVFVSVRFATYSGKNYLDIDHNASIDEVIRFLTE